MTFEKEQKVLFRHCDPAGIVFFPRYFEMMNDLVEAFFEEVLLWPFSSLHKTAAVPTAQIETRFIKPSEHGDLLKLGMAPSKVGSTSLGYVMTALCGTELRFETKATLVHVASDGRPTPWPHQVRERLMSYEAEHDT